MKPLGIVSWLITALSLAAVATGQGIGTSDAARPKKQKTVAIKVVVLIDAKTKGVTEAARIKQIKIVREAVAKKALAAVKEKNGQAMNRLNGTYVAKDAQIILADDGVIVECQVLVAVEPGRTILRDVKYVSTLRAVSNKEPGTWYGYTAVFDAAAPEDEAAENNPRAP